MFKVLNLQSQKDQVLILWTVIKRKKVVISIQRGLLAYKLAFRLVFKLIKTGSLKLLLPITGFICFIYETLVHLYMILTFYINWIRVILYVGAAME